jgi:uncharacterized membrane protein YkvA (DUF1232 family)
MKNPFVSFVKFFSESAFWGKIRRYASKAGVQAVYSALLLFYAYRRKDTPAWAKNIVLGVLGYLIAPIDAIPDLSPILGYTDDIGVLSFGLVTIATYIDDQVKEKARKQLQSWFKQYDQDDLAEVDKKL